MSHMLDERNMELLVQLLGGRQPKPATVELADRVRSLANRVDPCCILSAQTLALVAIMSDESGVALPSPDPTTTGYHDPRVPRSQHVEPASDLASTDAAGKSEQEVMDELLNPPIPSKAERGTRMQASDDLV